MKQSAAEWLKETTEGKTPAQVREIHTVIRSIANMGYEVNPEWVPRIRLLTRLVKTMDDIEELPDDQPNP